MTALSYVVQLRGRLGNQLFQYGMGEALRKSSGHSVLYHPRFRQSGDLALPSLLRDPLPLADAAALAAVDVIEGSSVGDRARRLVIEARSRVGVFRRSDRAFSESNPFAFDAELFELTPPVVLQGFFQNERYLTHGGADIAEHLALADPTTLLGELHAAGPTVVMSFRRGDYNVLGLTLPLEYYSEALDIVCARHPVESCVVVGDDRDFVRMATKYFEDRVPNMVDGLVASIEPVSQLALIAACDHCIIPNSSFAWWGAWLGDRRREGSERTVVVPEGWAAQGSPARSEWVRLPFGVGR